MLKDRNNWPILVVVAVVALVIGMILGKVLPDTASMKPAMNVNSASNFSVNKNSVFTHQVAIINGKVIKVDGRNLTIENINNHLSGSFMATDSIVIIKNSANSTKPPANSSDLKDIELNQPAFINLNLVGDKYVVTAVNYQTTAIPSPSVKPLVSPLPKK